MNTTRNHYLLLIRHARPQITPDKAAAQWPLSPAGEAQCPLLAELLAPYSPLSLFSSRELKARHTAALLSASSAAAVSTVAGLEEQRRRTVGYLPPERFHQQMIRLFSHPQQRVFGEESAEEACKRFSAAISGILTAHAGGNIGIVTHGTVMSLFTSRHNQLDAFTLWSHIGYAAVFVLALPNFSLTRICPDVARGWEPSYV